MPTSSRAASTTTDALPRCTPASRTSRSASVRRPTPVRRRRRTPERGALAGRGPVAVGALVEQLPRRRGERAVGDRREPAPHRHAAHAEPAELGHRRHAGSRQHVHRPLHRLDDAPDVPRLGQPGRVQHVGAGLPGRPAGGVIVSSRSSTPRMWFSARAVSTSPPACAASAAAATFSTARPRSWITCRVRLQSSIEHPARPVRAASRTVSAAPAGSSAKPSSRSALTGSAGRADERGGVGERLVAGHPAVGAPQRGGVPGARRGQRPEPEQGQGLRGAHVPVLPSSSGSGPRAGRGSRRSCRPLCTGRPCRCRRPGRRMTFMRAWAVATPGPIDGGPLRRRPPPGSRNPAPGEVRIRVRACGVCRTDLHLAEGDLPPRRPEVVPGTRSSGWSTRSGTERPGSAWATGWVSPGCAVLAGCRWCRPGAENLCPSRRSPAGTPTAATPSTRWSPLPSPTGSRTLTDVARAAPVRRHHRLPRPAPRRLPPAADWASTASGQRPPGRPGRPRRGCGCTSSPAASRRRAPGPRPGAAVGGAGRRPPPEPLDSAISSPRPASWCRWRCARWTGAGRWPWPAST